MNESEIVQVEDMQMAVSRPPEKVLAEAKQAAMALQSVIRGKAKPVKFNGEQYIEFEDWQVLARFYGLTAKIASTTPVDFGGVRGFEARAVVLDIKTGMEVSAADAMYAPVVCRFDIYRPNVSAATRAYMDAMMATPAWRSRPSSMSSTTTS